MRFRVDVVPLHQASRVGGPRFGCELVAVDDVTAVRRKRQIATRLRFAGPRLRELPRHPAHLDDRHRGAVGQHDSHLQQGLHAVADLFGGRARERLGTVAALQQERLATRRACQALPQNVDLTREHQRRKRRDLFRCGGDGFGIRPHRLLFDRQLTPIVETGDHIGICLHDGL